MIANLITLGNLCSGLLLLYLYSLENMITINFMCRLILWGSLLDCLDGPIARITQTTSSFGARLDSIADMVSFGFGPVVILYHISQLLPYNTPVTPIFGLIWIMVNLYREIASVKTICGNYHGCPSTFTAGALAGGLLFLDQSRYNTPEMLEFWMIGAIGWGANIMLDHKKIYRHERLIELNPVGSLKGGYNFLTLVSILLSLSFQGWQLGCWAWIWSGYCMFYIFLENEMFRSL